MSQVAHTLLGRALERRRVELALGCCARHARGQALARAIHVARARRSDAILRVDVRALAEASVYAIEGTLHGDAPVAGVDFAVGAAVFGVAEHAPS